MRASRSSCALRDVLCEGVADFLPPVGGSEPRPCVTSGGGSGVAVLRLRPCIISSAWAPDGVGFRTSSGLLRWRVPRRTSSHGWASLCSAAGLLLVVGPRGPVLGGARPPPLAFLAPLAVSPPSPAPAGCGIACANGEVNDVCAAVLPRSSSVRGLVLGLRCTSCCWSGPVLTLGLSGRGGVLSSSSKAGGWPMCGPSAGVASFGTVGGGVVGTGSETAISGFKTLKWVWTSQRARILARASAAGSWLCGLDPVARWCVGGESRVSRLRL